jgi:hypothetical protein
MQSNAADNPVPREITALLSNQRIRQTNPILDRRADLV